MPPSGFLDSVYERSASFGRDVFHYMVTGTMVVIVGSVPWWSMIRPAEVPESSRIALLLVAAAIPVFSLGHVLLAIGFWIRNKIVEPKDTWWEKLWNKRLVWFFQCRVQLRDYHCAIKRMRRALPDSSAVACESSANVHLGLEMSVFLRHPRLHAVFVERYNTLWHLRLGLAASFLMAGVVNLVFAICSLCLQNQRCPVAVCVVVGLVSIVLGGFLLRQHLITNTNFLQRLIVAFKFCEKNG